jgi:putative sugar O-methyltransferase
MLFPRKMLAEVGGFDVVLGDAYQSRYLLRLKASGVSAVFIESSSSYVTPPSGSADQTTIAAFANLNQCFRERQLWSQIPAVVRDLTYPSYSPVRNPELASLKTRVLDFTLKTIRDLSANATGRCPLAAFAFCLAGFEWGPANYIGSRPSELDLLRSAILDGASGISLNSLGELSLTQALAETIDDPSFRNAAARALATIQELPHHAGLRDALRRLSSPSRGSRRTSKRLSLFERLRWDFSGPSSITDDPKFRGLLRMAATNPIAFARFRSDVLDKVTELNFKTGAQYAQSFLTMSPVYEQLLPEFRRNDEIGDPKVYQYPEIGRFSAATLRYIKFLSDIETLFGSLEGMHIVELGAGYGGQCRVIMSRFKPATYTIIDLPEMLGLARRYLNSFGLEKDITFRRPFQRLPQPSADLVISNYAVSEIRRSEQDRYLNYVIKPARRGYVLYNASRLSGRIKRYTGEAPYELTDFAARIEGATIETAWPLVVDRDRDLGNALIYWQRPT